MPAFFTRARNVAIQAWPWLITLCIACWFLGLWELQTGSRRSPADFITGEDWHRLTILWARNALILTVASLLALAGFARRCRAGAVGRALVGFHCTLIGLVVVPFAFLPVRVEYDHIIAVCLIILTAGLCFAFGVTRWKSAANRSLLTDRSRSIFAWSAVCLAAAVFAAYFACLALARCWALLPRTADMSYENQAVWSAYHAWPMWSSIRFYGSYLREHTPYIYFLVGLIHHFDPRPELLVVLQAIVLAAGAPILLLLLRAMDVPQIAATVFAIAYLLHPALQGLALFDFHSSPLALPFIFLMWYGLHSRHTWCLVAGAILTLSAREELALIVAATGLYGLAGGRRAGWSIALLLAGAGYFLLNTRLIMPYFGAPGQMGGNVARFEELLTPAEGHGPMLRLAMTLLASPLRIVEFVLQKPRLEYLVLICLPSAGLCWLGGWRTWLLLAPGLFVTLLSDRPAHYQIGFQYSTMLLAAVSFTAALGWKRISLVRESPPPLVRESLLAPTIVGIPSRAVTGAGFALCLVCFCAVCANYLYGSFCSKTYKLQYVYAAKPEPALKDPIKYGVMIWCSTEWPQPSPLLPFLRQAQSIVPPEASILADEVFHPFFSSRRDAFRRKNPREAEFVLVANNPQTRRWAPEIAFQPVLEVPEYVLLRRIIEEKSPGEFIRLIDPAAGDQHETLEVVPLIENGGFETGTLAGWHTTGNAFNGQPVKGEPRAHLGIHTGPRGQFWIGTYEKAGDEAAGTLECDPFTIDADLITFLLGGGKTQPSQSVQLRSNGKKLLEARPQASGETMKRHYWDVRPYRGRVCTIQIIDAPAKGWSHINVDDFIGLRLPNP